MSKFSKALLLSLFAAFACTPIYASELSDAANSLSPGEWTELSTSGFTNSILLQGGGHDVFQFTDSMKWDPVRKEVNFVGSGHLQPYVHIVYQESTNSWSSNSTPGYFDTSHGYDHMALDPVGRKFYFRQFFSGRLEIFDLDSQSWSRGSGSYTSGMQVAAGIAWFPEQNGVMLVDGDNGLFKYSPSSDNWQTVSNNTSGLGPYHNFAEYSPVHKVVIYGGGNGSRAVYRMDASGQITRMADAPFNVGITASMIVVDPVSGNFLVFNDNSFYEFDPIANSWLQQNVSIPYTSGQTSGVVGATAVPISTYGVVMITKYAGNSSRVYVYKHAPGGGTPPPPTPTLSFSASSNSVPSGSNVMLDWQSSNTADCTASGAWSGPKTLSGQETVGPLTSNSTFNLECSGQGGVISRSASVTVTGNDTTPPTIDDVTAVGDPNQVTVTFSEPVDSTGAETTSNYALNNGVQVTGASLSGSGRVATLNTSDLTDGTQYTLTVNGIYDRASNPNPIANNTTANFIFDAGATGGARNLNPPTYEWGVLSVGEQVYVDRSWVFSSVPRAYANMEYIRTANDDRLASGSQFLTFDASEPTTVYVGYAAGSAGVPAWLQSWDATNDQVTTGADASSQDATLDIYKKDFAAGTVALGGNEMGNTMYTVFITETTGGSGGGGGGGGGGSSTDSGGGSTGLIALLGMLAGLLVRLGGRGRWLVALALFGIGTNAIAQSTPDEDWAARSTASGVVMSTRFDTRGEVDNWVLRDGLESNVTWDQSVSTSGAGSLRFDIRNTHYANSGNWKRYLSDDQRVFGNGDEYYVQYRQYVPAYYASHVFSGGGGWKSSILSWFDSSFQSNEIVIQNTLHRGYIQGYNQSGSFDLWETNKSTACSQYDFVHQPEIDNGPNPLGSGFTACENDRARYGGLYSFGHGGPQDPLTGAVRYYADEWITILQHVRLNNLNGSGNLIETWAARDGDDYVLLYSDANRTLGGDNGGHNAVWLLPYNTGKNPDSSSQNTFTNYDELIVSTNFISAPGFPGGNPPPPPPPPPPSGDVTPPEVVSVTTEDGNDTRVTVLFDEAIDQSSAQTRSNYFVEEGLSINRARLGSDDRTVVLTTGNMQSGFAYHLTVSNVTDIASPPNPIAANTRIEFTYSDTTTPPPPPPPPGGGGGGGGGSVDSGGGSLDHLVLLFLLGLVAGRRKRLIGGENTTRL